MTATSVNGVPVVDQETVASGLGRGIRYTRQLRLRLADGTSTFGCGEEGCTYTDEKVGRVRFHIGEAHPKPTAMATRQHPGMAASPSGTVRVFRQLTKELERLTDDRNRWRRRAGAAEGDLRAIRRALGASS